MFYSCPHCRELVATDRETRLPPALCPRCGGALREPDAGQAAPPATVESGLSFASFLRGGETPDAGPSAAGPAVPQDVMENAQPNEAEASTAATLSPNDEEGIPHPGASAESAGIEPDAAGPDSPVATRPVPQATALPHGHAPSFTRTPVSMAARPHAAKWQWVVVFLLSSLLMVQVLVADRARLAAEAGWRPTITALCGVLRCPVPAWHQPGAISMLSRDVSPLAGRNGGLDVRATFRNDARWSQPWPVLMLSLSDADGRVLGSRAFLPHEYLGPDTAQTELAPGQSARIALQLHEPNPDVVAFSFDFR